jgi:hypothetical protein
MGLYKSGYYCPTGSTTMIVCPVGTYNPNFMATSCLSCNATNMYDPDERGVCIVRERQRVEADREDTPAIVSSTMTCVCAPLRNCNHTALPSPCYIPAPSVNCTVTNGVCDECPGGRYRTAADDRCILVSSNPYAACQDRIWSDLVLNSPSGYFANYVDAMTVRTL